MQELSAAYKASGRGPPQASFDNFKLIQLDRPVKLPGLTVIDNLDSKPKRIDFTNCYFRDGMNCGIVSKGAIDSLIANCIVERTSKAGIEHSIGGEGSFAGLPLDCSFTAQECQPSRTADCDKLQVHWVISCSSHDATPDVTGLRPALRASHT